MNSYVIISRAVRDFWRSNYPEDVVVFFQQKYSIDEKWEICIELVECRSSDDFETVIFHSDFCEGQTEVKDVVIVSLSEVTEFFYERKIKAQKEKNDE